MDDRFRVRQVRVLGDRAVASTKLTLGNLAEVLSAMADELGDMPIEEVPAKVRVAKQVCDAAQRSLEAIEALVTAAAAIKP